MGENTGMDVLQLLLTPGVLVGGVVVLWRVYVYGRFQDREYVKSSFDKVQVELSHLSEGVADVRSDLRSLGERVTDIDKRLVALGTLVQERSSMGFAAGIMAMQNLPPGAPATRQPLPAAEAGPSAGGVSG